MVRWIVSAALVVASACAPPPGPAPAIAIEVVPGHDWSLPPGVGVRQDAGFYGDEPGPHPRIDARVLDLTWRQLEPTEGELRTDTFGSAAGLDFAPWVEQRAAGGRYWLRLWLSGLDWAPTWVVDACRVQPVSGMDGDGQYHLPLWHPCVWSKLRALWARLADAGVLADPDLVLVYVPGGFTWLDFDFEVIDRAVLEDGLDATTFRAWFATMLTDLAAVAGPDVGKLVYTGEDYPRASFGPLVDDLAADAVAAGLGVRLGRAELTNDHRARLPAWGATVTADGRAVLDPARPARLRAVELDCFDACGQRVADADELAYAIRTSTASVLALGAQWIYVVFPDSHLDDHADHWRWVRAELGRGLDDAFDAWVVLREAEDRVWAERDDRPWTIRPWVRDFARFIEQRPVAPDGVTARGRAVHTGVLDARNGTAYEGRRTDAAAGGRALYFAVDPGFLTGPRAVTVHVTFVDDCDAWRLAYVGAAGPTESPAIGCGGSAAIKTARIHLPDARFVRGLAGATDLAVVRAGAADVEVQMLRIVR